MYSNHRLTKTRIPVSVSCFMYGTKAELGGEYDTVEGTLEGCETGDSI